MTRSKSPWSSFRFKKSKKEADGSDTAGGAEALRDYFDDDDTLRTIGKTSLGTRGGGLIWLWPGNFIISFIYIFLI